MLTSAVLLTLVAASPTLTDYTDRKIQTREASFLADGMKVAVGEFVNKYNRLPASNEEAGLPAPTLIHGKYAASGAISGSRITFEFGPRADASLVGKHLFFEAVLRMKEQRVDSIAWYCKSEDLPQEACPKSCTCSG